MKIEMSAQSDYTPVGKAWDRCPVSNLEERVKTGEDANHISV